MKDYNFKHNQSQYDDIFDHLSRMDQEFMPKLSSYVNIEDYSFKLFEKAQRFEFWDGKVMTGLIAYYENKEEENVFITNVSVEKNYRLDNFSTVFMESLADELKRKGYKKIKLEIKKINTKAHNFYLKNSFFTEKDLEGSLILAKFI